MKKLDSLGFDLSDNNLNKVIGKRNLWSLSFNGKIFYDLIKEEILYDIFNKSEFKECEECFPIWKISSFYAYCLRKFKRKRWSGVLNECNLNKHVKKIPSYSKDEIITSLKEFNGKKEGIWFVKDLRKENHKLYHAISNNFRKEGLKEACLEAGINYDKIRAQESWSKKRIKNEIRSLFAQEKRVLRFDLENSKNVEERRLFASARRVYNQYNLALIAAGFIPKSLAKYYTRIDDPYSKDKVVDNLLELFRRSILDGCQYTSRKYVQEKDPELMNAAIRHFKSWDKALEYCGIDPNCSLNTISRTATSTYGLILQKVIKKELEKN